MTVPPPTYVYRPPMRFTSRYTTEDVSFDHVLAGHIQGREAFYHVYRLATAVWDYKVRRRHRGRLRNPRHENAPRTAAPAHRNAHLELAKPSGAPLLCARQVVFHDVIVGDGDKVVVRLDLNIKV